MFFGKQVSNFQNSTIWNLMFTSFTDIVVPRNTLIQQKHNHSESCIKVEKSAKTQNVEIPLAIGGIGLAFSITAREIFSQVMLVSIRGWCWEENNLTNQNVLTTVSVYILSWYPRT